MSPGTLKTFPISLRWNTSFDLLVLIGNFASQSTAKSDGFLILIEKGTC